MAMAFPFENLKNDRIGVTGHDGQGRGAGP